MQVIRVNRALHGVILAVVFFVFTPDGRAADFGVFAGGSYGNLNTLRRGGLGGPAGNLGLQLQLTDFWGVAVDGGASYHFENKKDELAAESVVSTSLQVRYYADMFE